MELIHHDGVLSHIASRPPLSRRISPAFLSWDSTLSIVGRLTPGQLRSTSANLNCLGRCRTLSITMSRFAPRGRLHSAHACLKLTIGSEQHAQEVLEPREQVVFGFVPPHRRLRKCLVVALARVLDDALKAHVAAHVDARMV